MSNIGEVLLLRVSVLVAAYVYADDSESPHANDLDSEPVRVSILYFCDSVSVLLMLTLIPADILGMRNDVLEPRLRL